ncbi:conserved oligomeric Golgi complex subunit 1 isoform X2 [Trichomycterus rosablanca]|uniref:conserved oligomeric Golgi complex subunit 1 isoform X2 n=1 Tax=Trichomycterus rosablanca TaxID=2290929 RepID=UPI002F357CA9
MAAVPVQSLRVADIKDPAELFERYSAEEIRLVERKVREQIEQKKEELRYMVGERYRDLIEAADTIGEMRGCSEKVTEKQSQEKFYTMAAQIRLLLEMPERMWSALEGSQYLQATQLYLLCAHLHRLLHLDTPAASYSPVLSRFPILIQQVAAAGHFRSTILMDSRSVLRGRAVSDQAIAEALVSTMLLEGSSPRQALADFLLARTASIQQLLKQPQHGSGIKAQVCSLVELLVTTLYQAHAVFYLPPEGRSTEPGPGHGLLFSTLENVTSGKGRTVLQGEEASAGTWFRYLPPSVVEFQPTLRTLAQPIQREHLRETLQSWIHTCEEDMRSGVSSLLVYVRSVKALASIRDAVFDLLSSDSISQYWSSVCQNLLEKHLNLWKHLLHPLFHQRLQVMTQEGMDQISSSCKQLLSSTLRDLEGETASRGSRFEGDVSAFLWSESQSDLPADAAWVGVSQRGPRPESGLSMKTHALTPRVQAFCAALDSRLKAQLEDLGHFLPPDAPAPSSSHHTDGAAVEAALSERCHACITDILAGFRAELASSGHTGSVLFLARLCQSAPELCPSLKRCILGRQGEARNAGSPRTQSRKPQKGGAGKGVELSPAQVAWGRLKEELLACSTEAYRIWSAGVTQALVSSFGSSLRADTPGSVLVTATQWDELEIQEEAESGNTVTSKIRLPVQPSWYVQSLLFRLCLEVNKVGGHAVPRVTLTELLRSVLDQVVVEYDGLTEHAQKRETAPPVTQNRALQLLFDVRYLSAALSARSEEKSSRPHLQPRIQRICDDLESYVDPFDLDVFTPHLNANLNRLTQRTSVLLGLLTGVEKNFSSRSSSVSSQEPYNILPLSSSQIRFGLLPLSMTSSRKTKSSSSSSSSGVLAAPSSNPVAENTFQPGNRFRQLANQEEEPAGPSLFKLGWLSGMAK